MKFYKETNLKSTPVGKIPRDWKVSKLTEVADYINGYAFSPKDWKSKGLPIIRIQNLNDPTAEFNYFDGRIDERYLVKNGDLLLAWSASIGCYLWNRGDAWLNQHIFKVIPKQGVNREYLYYALLKAIEQLKRRVHGSTMKHFKRGELKTTYIPLPPEEREQRGIVEVLSCVDLAIQKVDEAIARTERLKKGLMQELLTKGIGHKEFKDTEIGRIPKEWKVVRIREIGTLQYGVTTSAKKEDTGIKLLRITDIKGEGIHWSEVPHCEVSKSELMKYKLKIGDVLFARIGATTGKTCYIDRPFKGVFGSYLIRFQPTTRNVNTKFLYFYTQSAIYWRQVNRIKEGQLKRGLNSRTLGNLRVPFPPVDEQRKIAEILSTVDKMLEVERKRKEKLERIKKALMDLLLTGKVRVRVSL